MKNNRLVLILSISTAILAILGSLLWWWGVFYSDGLYGISFIDVFIWLFDNKWFVLLDPTSEPAFLIYYVFALVFLAGGIITIINGFKPKKFIIIISVVLVSSAVVLMTLFTLGFLIMTEMGIEYFFFYLGSDYIIGLGPGFYLGIAALILDFFNLHSTLNLVKS
ncbi:MAG: hypothetical protein ACTSQO_04400 [Candidatus Helarchaeota archaeon]